MDKFANIDKAAHSGANGHNHKRPATPGQQAAGNYEKGREVLHGLRLVIENPRGSVREWRAADGTSGGNLMKFHYGYIAGTLGNDGDELDVFIGPTPEAMRAYVVNQNRTDGSGFDEHKIMLGFPDQRTAVAGYMSNYTAPWPGFGSVVACSIDQLKWWIANGNKTRPLTQDQLPYEGTDDTMEKVIWDSAAPLTPLRSTLDAVLYGIRAHDAADGLLYDAVSMADVLGDADGVLTFDALVVPLARLEQRMGIMQKVLDRTGRAVKVAAMQVSDPFTQRGTTNVAVIYELTDGQTVSVFFHNPDVTPKKITPGDELVSWKWMLNKKDITVAVAPEKGRDLEPRTVAARIMALAEKNSERFAKANTKRAERMETIAGLQTELDTKKATLAELEQQVEALQAERDAAGLDDPEPVNPDPQPDPQPEPEPAPAPSLDVDSLKGVVAYTDPMAGVPHGDNWVLMNAPRPLLGTETMSNGEFLTGRFYAAIDPADSMAAAYIAENIKLDARVVFIADAKTQEIMALNTLNPKYLPAYMGMDDDERGPALRGFIDKLHNRTIGELKALAAKGMPVVDMWRKEVEAFAFNRPGFFGRALELTNSDLLNQNRAPGTWTITKLGDGTYAALFTNLGGVTYTMTERVGSIEQAHAAMLAHPDYIAATAPAPEPEPAELTAEEKQALSDKRDLFIDALEENPNRGGADQMRAEIERINGILGPLPEKAKRAAVERLTAAEGDPAYMQAIYDLLYKWESSTAEQRLDSKFVGQMKRDIRTLAKKVPASDEKAVFYIDKLVLAVFGDYDPKVASVEFAPAVPVVDPAEKEAQEAEEAADGDFLALAAEGNVDFYDKAVTDRLAALARKYTDPEGAYLDLVMQAKTAAKNFFVNEFKKKVA